MEPNAEQTSFEELKASKGLPVAAHVSAACRWIRCGTTKLPLFTTGLCTSSMDMAWHLSTKCCFPDWASVLAAAQSAGRGQFGRSWHSPAGNLYATVRIQRPGPAWNDLLPLMLAEAMRGVLKRFGVAPSIKWPNDLIIGGKKVGGILVESRNDIVMAGLGLNLVSAPQPDELRHPLAQPAGCLGQSGLRLTPMQVWIPFIREARSLIGRALLDGDPRRFVDNLTPHLAYRGETVLLDAYAAGQQPAVFLGLDEVGAIRVLTAEGERTFRSGSLYPMIQS
jgi:BirA family biotin operon repressor/biotin-[acetyl-CoA-carboxylase] ligase